MLYDLMELPDESTAYVNKWDTEQRLADGWVLITEGVRLP
jgi:hypothetical protein